MNDETAAPIVAAVTDLEQLAAVAPLFDAYRTFYRFAPDPQGAYGFLHARWSARESVLFFAHGGDARPLGFVHLYPIFLSGAMRRFWLLNDLFVAPEARRRGVGRALLRRAERHARETGAAGLTLSTAVTNATAQHLYEREGYLRDRDFYTYNREFA